MEDKRIREIIKKEALKCKRDPSYFMRKHCHIQTPKGRTLFELYPFQDKVLKIFKKNDFSIVLKSRQLGISTLSAGYALWLMLFHEDRNILALATTQQTARNLLLKVQFMYDQLPSWLKQDFEEYNKLSLRLTNGSRIVAASSSSNAARSESVSLLIIDEAAFIDNIEKTFTSAQQTLATGGQCIALSTPNGVGNWFHRTYKKAELKENSFVPIKLKWNLHPDRDQEWRDRQDRDLGPKQAAQECDCSFLSSGDTVIPSDILKQYEEATEGVEPIERRGEEGDLHIYKPPDYSVDYMVVADVARGDGEDFSTFHVIDIEAVEQVAELKSKLPPREFGNLLVSIATEYNDALLVVENATIGWSTITQIQDRGYENLYYSSKNPQETAESYMAKYESDSLTPGFSMNTATRPLVIAKLQEYMRDLTPIIKSKRLLSELRVFIWKNAKAQAQKGYNDDLVMAFAIALYVRDGALKMREDGLDKMRAQLDTFTRLNRRDKKPVYNTEKLEKNPYIQETNKGKMDYSWLLKK